MKKEGYLITGDDIASMGLTLLPGKEHLKGKFALTKDEIINTYFADVSGISDNVTCVTYERVIPSIYLNLSKSAVNFLASGGSDAITIDTNVPSNQIKIEYDGNIFSYNLNDKTLNITAASLGSTEKAKFTDNLIVSVGSLTKTITINQEENKLVSVTATGTTSSGTIMDVSASGGSVTWTPTVEYTSGWSGTPPSGVTITYSSSSTDATQLNNVTTWPNRNTTIGKRRESNITLSASSSYTTTPVTGIVTTGQNMNTVTAVKFIDCQGGNPGLNFSAKGGEYCYVGELTLTSGATTHGAQYKDYITYNFESDFGAWNLDEKGYFGTVSAPSRKTTIGNEKSGTLTHKISGTINGVSINKTATLGLTQAVNTITSFKFVNSLAEDPTTSFTAAGGHGPYYPYFTWSSGSVGYSKTALSKDMVYTISGSGFRLGDEIDAASSYGIAVVADSRGATIGPARNGVVTGTLNTTINGVTINKSLSQNLTQSLNKITTLAIIPSAGAADTTSYTTGNFAASGGTKTPTTSSRVVATFSSGSHGYTGASGAWYGGTLSISRAWSMATATGFSMNTSTGAVTASNRGATIGPARTCAPKCVISASYTNPSSVGGGVVNATSVTDTFTLTQDLNTITSIRIVGTGPSTPLTSLSATANTPGYSAIATFSTGTEAELNNYASYVSYSFNQSWGTWTSSGYYGILTVASRGTTIGAARSGVLTCTVKGTINGVAVNKSGTLTITQALNKVVSCTETNNTLSYPSIAAAGGTSSPSGMVTARFTYSSGASGDPEGYTASKSFSMTTASGFSINTTSGVVTATNNTSTSSRTSGTITRTAKYSYKNPSSVGGDTVSTTVTKTATCTQSAGSKSYANPVVSLSYATIPAKGGTVSPTLSYSQTWGWNGSTTGGGTITSGATVSYSGTSVNTTNGSVTAGTKGSTPSNITTVTTATATVKLNGKTGTKSVAVKQQANTVDSYDYGSYTATLSANDTSTLSAGATTRTITWGYIRRSKTPIYTSTSHGTATTETYSGTAYLTVSVSSGTSYCTLNKSSYTNSSSATSSTLTKNTYGTTEIPTAQTYTLHVRMGSASGTSVASLSIKASTNIKTEIAYGSWVVSVSANRYTTSSSPCPAGGGTATITRSASRTRTQKYTSGDTSPLSNETATPTLSISGTGFSLSGTTVTAANRSTTEGALRSGVVTATHSGVSKNVTIYQQANEKYREYSDLVGHISSTSWSNKANYTSFWATGSYTEKYTSGASGASGSSSIPWDSVTFGGADWVYYDSVQGALKWYDNTGLERSTTITGRIGSWTYSVEVTQKAGMSIGRLYLHVPVNIGYVEYWNIYVNSTSGGQIWSGNPEQYGSANNILKMPEECAIIVAQNGGTVSFSTTYSTATDRNYRGSISGTEQDRLANGEDVTVYLT